MDVPARILPSCLAAAWLIRVGLAWPRRYASSLWAWIRIVSGIAIFFWSELMLWRPQTPYLDYLLYGAVLVYLGKFFVKRKISTPDF
jgi:hypothetical protein